VRALLKLMPTSPRLLDAYDALIADCAGTQSAEVASASNDPHPSLKQSMSVDACPAAAAAAVTSSSLVKYVRLEVDSYHQRLANK
jgi:hypothetical protein